jgi:integrase
MKWGMKWGMNFMKPRRAHPDKVLTAAKVKKVSEAGRHADGNGLYLVVDPSGARRWVLRTVVHGRRRDIGLGGLKIVSLAEARDLAMQYRRIARDGGDPLQERRKARRIVPTFEAAARSVYEEHKATWRNVKHASQWINTLAQYVFPLLGDRPVDQIDTPDLLRVLTPIWLTKPETARRVRQRISTVLDWAKAAGHRSGDNPVAGVAKGLPKQPDRKTHLAALPYAEVPAFVHRLRASDATEVVSLAFEFLILTAARTSEVLEAKWKEIDLKAAIWTIPGSRMKAGREHRVPLAPVCITILQRAREFAPEGEYLFTGRSNDRPLSNMAFLMSLRRLKLDITAHGFRSAFRDWASERTNFPNEVCELALAHTIKNKVEAAYRRGDLLDRRRELMSTWAEFVTSAEGKVVKLRA